MNPNRLFIKRDTIGDSAQLDLQKTMELFFQDEHLNDFKCEKCNSIEEVCIQRKFKKMPRILILHLKRYQFKEIQVENEMEAIFNDLDPKSPTAPLTEEDPNLPAETKTTTTKEIRYKLVKNDQSVQIPKYIDIEPFVCRQSNLQLPSQLTKQVLYRIEAKRKFKQQRQLQQQHSQTKSEDNEKELCQKLGPRTPLSQRNDNLQNRTQLTPRQQKILANSVALSESKKNSPISNENQMRSPLARKNLSKHISQTWILFLSTIIV